jgi:hypothetical protein
MFDDVTPTDYERPNKTGWQWGLIHRQKAEIKRLEGEIERYKFVVDMAKKTIAKHRSAKGDKLCQAPPHS